MEQPIDINLDDMRSMKFNDINAASPKLYMKKNAMIRKFVKENR